LTNNLSKGGVKMDKTTSKELEKSGYKMASSVTEFNQWFLTITGESDQKIKMGVIKKIQSVKQKHKLPPGTHIIPLWFRG
jgi:hypothetical protein